MNNAYTLRLVHFFLFYFNILFFFRFEFEKFRLQIRRVYDGLILAPS